MCSLMACFCVLLAGMVIQTVVFFICFLFLVFLIIIPIFYGRNVIVFEIAGKAWWVRNHSCSSFSFCHHWVFPYPAMWCLRPVWVTMLLVTALQHVTAKFAFIKKESGTRDLNNRYVKPFLTHMLEFNFTKISIHSVLFR